MIRAAKMIIADHPFGVGPNQYLLVANIGGYSSRAGVAWNAANRSAPVHNSYYFITAELGFLGLIGMMTILLSMIWTGFRAIKRSGLGERADLLVGVTSTLIIVSAHLAFEWLVATNYVQYLLAMCIGMLAGITAPLRQKAGAKRASKPAPARAGFASQPG